MATKPHTTWPHADLTGFLAEHGDDAELEQLADAFLVARRRDRREPTAETAEALKMAHLLWLSRVSDIAKGVAALMEAAFEGPESAVAIVP